MPVPAAPVMKATPGKRVLAEDDGDGIVTGGDLWWIFQVKQGSQLRSPIAVVSTSLFGDVRWWEDPCITVQTQRCRLLVVLYRSFMEYGTSGMPYCSQTTAKAHFQFTYLELLVASPNASHFGHGEPLQPHNSRVMWGRFAYPNPGEVAGQALRLSFASLLCRKGCHHRFVAYLFATRCHCHHLRVLHEGYLRSCNPFLQSPASAEAR